MVVQAIQFLCIKFNSHEPKTLLRADYIIKDGISCIHKDFYPSSVHKKVKQDLVVHKEKSQIEIAQLNDVAAWKVHVRNRMADVLFCSPGAQVSVGTSSKNLCFEVSNFSIKCHEWKVV